MGCTDPTTCLLWAAARVECTPLYRQRHSLHLGSLGSCSSVMARIYWCPLCSWSCSSNGADPVLAFLSSPSFGRRSLGRAVLGIKCSKGNKRFGVLEGQVAGRWPRGRVGGDV